MKIKANLILPNAQEMMASVGLNQNGAVQKYIDNFVIKQSRPYLPGRRHLYQSSVISTKIGSGTVIWNTVDANYLYEGKLMVDELTHSAWARKGTQKILDPKGRNLHYDGEPQRGKDWFNRMMTDNQDNLIKGIQHIIENGGNQ